MRIIILIGVFLMVLPLFAQDQSAIQGTVVDTQKLSLPGATVHLKKTGDAAESTAYTNEEGKFSFPDLSQGTFDISAEMDGFQTMNAEVTLDGSAVRTIEIELPQAQNIREDVTVVADNSGLLEKQETQHKNELDERVLDYAPIASQRFQDALPLVPSVVRGPDGLINMNGARATESTLLVNGSNVTDPVTGNFAVELPSEAVDNVQVYTNPYSAEYGKFSGGVTTVSTKAGEDRFKMEFNDFLPRFHYEDGLKGVEAWTPRVRVSGPTSIKNLYFSEAVQYKLNRTYLDDLPQDANRIQVEGVDSITQFDYRPSSTDQWTATLSAFPEKVTNVNLNTFLPAASTPDFKQGGFNLAISDRRFFNDGSFLESSFSSKTYDVSVLPKGDLSRPFEVTIEGDTGSYFNYQDRNSSRLQWTGAYTFRPTRGSHLFRAGVDIARTSYSGTVAYSPVEIRGTENRLLERIDFVGSGTLGHSNSEVSSYIQDHWTPSSEFTLDWGLRMDLDTLSSRANLGPRAAMAYSPDALPKTVFKSGIGVFYDKIFLNAADFEQYPSRQISEYDDQGNLIRTNLLVNRLAGNVKAPRSITWNAGVDQQVSSRVLLRSNFLMRRGRDQFVLTPAANNLLLSNDGKSRYWEWELTGQVRLSEDSHVTVSYVHSRTKGNLNDFDTYFGNFQRPILREDADSFLPFDSPNRFLVWGVVRIPGKVYVSPLLEIRDGFPYSAIDQAQQYVGKRNSSRFPVFTQLDMRVTRTFTVFSKYKVTAGMKVYNILNHFNPRDVQNNINSPALGTFYNGLARTFRGAFEIQY